MMPIALTSAAPLLTGAPNFRDLGGYVSADGRRIRPRLIYRSESLTELTDQDLATVASLGIRLICDLRSDHERRQFPSRWPKSPPASRLHLDISTDLRAGHEAMTRALLDDPSAQGATQAMLLSYRQFPTAFAPHLALLFDRLLASDGLPFMFHCAAGKDRTGFVAALLLSALDVSWEQVLEDYLLTARHWHGPRSEAALRRVLHALFGDSPPPADILRPLMAVEGHYLATAFEAITSQYTSIEAYLERTAGLDAKRRAALQDALLE